MFEASENGYDYYSSDNSESVFRCAKSKLSHEMIKKNLENSLIANATYYDYNSTGTFSEIRQLTLEEYTIDDLLPLIDKGYNYIMASMSLPAEQGVTIFITDGKNATVYWLGV